MSIETNKEDHIPPNFFVELGLTKVLKECRFDQEMEPCHIKTLPIKELKMDKVVSKYGFLRNSFLFILVKEYLY